jgi:hypothetical protein
MAERLTPEKSAQLDRMIASGRFSVSQMVKATGATSDNVKTRRKRRRRLMGQGGQLVVPSSSISIEGAELEDPESPRDVPLTPAGVRAELHRGLTRLKEMERTLQDDGPQAMPAITALLGEQRKTIEAILKAEVVFANMPSASVQETPQQRAAEIRAYFQGLLGKLSPAAKDELLKLMTGEQ